MTYKVLASDYDGTLIQRDRMDEATLAALTRWKERGRRLLLITGRTREQMKPEEANLLLFDLLILENGALLHDPQTGAEEVLGQEVPAALVEQLQAQQVEPLVVGRSIISTYREHEATMLRALQELGLDWQTIPNKESLMALPPGVDKTVGLRAALHRLGIALEETVGTGDAENDESFLALCGYSAAVANALPALKQRVRYVAQGEYGAGVAEVLAMVSGC
jgi:hypothetical protein